MGRPDFDDSVAGDSAAGDLDHVYLIGDSTGSLTASGDGNLGSVQGTLQESDNGTP